MSLLKSQDEAGLLAMKTVFKFLKENGHTKIANMMLEEHHAILTKGDLNAPELKDVIQHFNQCNDFVLKFLTTTDHEKTAKKFGN